MTDDTKQCPYCAETIKAEAIVCRFCGRDLSSPKPANATPVITAKNKKPISKTLLFLVIVVILACCGFIFLSVILSPQKDKTVTSSTETVQNPTQSITPQATSQPPTTIPKTLAPSIEEILATVEGMTDVQRNQYMESLAGNRVEDWRGIVSEVDEGEILGGFSVYVDMVEGNFGYEVSIEVTKEIALSLSKGQEIVFSGDIESVSDILGTTVYIKNAVIVPAQ